MGVAIERKSKRQRQPTFLHVSHKPPPFNTQIPIELHYSWQILVDLGHRTYFYFTCVVAILIHIIFFGNFYY